jgi:hypothetical protein
MRHARKYPETSKFPTLIGFDEEEEETSEETSENEIEEQEESEEEEEESSSGGETSEKDTSGLKSALKKEREARKQYEKELKELRKFKEELEDKDKSEAQKAADRAEKAEKALEAAQGALRNTQLDFAISGVARKMRFRDVDDALIFVNRDEIEFDDDGDFDKKAVEKAVKAIADKKPHLLLSEGEGAPSGSKFGGKKKTDKKATEEQLKKKYPALGR